MDPMIVECPLGQSMQTILPFKNPLDKPLIVKAMLLEKNKVEGKGTWTQDCVLAMTVLRSIV